VFNFGEKETSLVGLGPTRWPVFLILLIIVITVSIGGAAMASQEGTIAGTAIHSQFEVLQQEFKTGPEVTEACLSCHIEASKQVMHTNHWTWRYYNEVTGQELGKANVLNNYCVGTASNEVVCMTCHIGYDWTDQREILTDETKVDCLVCHDTTGTYKKASGTTGHPVYEGENAVDLPFVAQNVGATSRDTCGTCHFNGGGDDGVKHGDLDSSLKNPSFAIDVHMSPEGNNFTCSTCHVAVEHDIPGSHYGAIAKDTTGVKLPSIDPEIYITCEACHGLEAHKNERLNQHSDKIACQTCHIPSFSRGGIPTKVSWDWSTAGKIDEDCQPFTIKEEQGRIIYDSKKGDFAYDENIIPEYHWFDGQLVYHLPGDEIENIGGPVSINAVRGGYDDPDSRIWPFKVMHSKQPYDVQSKKLLNIHTAGNDDTAFWCNFDWEKALQAGSDYIGESFSGEYDFIDTIMYWPIKHMVAPKEDALACIDCHSENGRLADLQCCYIPGTNKWPTVTGFGVVAFLGTLFAAVGHGSLRFVNNKRKGGKE